MKRLFGLAIGLVVGLGAMLGLEWLNTQVLLPNEYVPTAGGPAQAMIVAGWALLALAGGVAAVRVADWPASGWIVALLAIGVALAQSLASPHPLWMQIAAVVAPLLAGVVVSGIARPA